MEHIDIGNPANDRDYGNKECPKCLGTGRDPFEDGFAMCSRCYGDGMISKTKEEFEDGKDDWKTYYGEKD